MSAKLLYMLIAALVLVGAGFYWYDSRQRQAQAPIVDTKGTPNITEQYGGDLPLVATTPAAAPDTSTKPSDLPQPSEGRFSNEEDITAPDIQVHEVVYTGSSFNPATLTIKAGDIVVFKNNSESDFWPASAPHPSHNDYPGFDAQKEIAAGGTFQFKFIKVGTWGYHNHLKSSVFGKIIVTN